MSLLAHKRTRNRRFDYEPRYYKPEKDDRLKRRMRVGMRKQRRRSPAGLIYFGIMFIMALYVYLNMG